MGKLFLTVRIARCQSLCALLVLSLILSGCGFKLRGYSAETRATSVTVALLQAKNSGTGLAELHLILNSLLEGNASLSDLANADRIIRLVDEQLVRRTLTRTATGRAQELQLELVVKASFVSRQALSYLTPAAGVSSGATTESVYALDQNSVSELFSAHRSYRYDNTQVLAAHNYELTLVAEMRRELAEIILQYALNPSLELAD